MSSSCRPACFQTVDLTVKMQSPTGTRCRHVLVCMCRFSCLLACSGGAVRSLVPALPKQRLPSGTCVEACIAQCTLTCCAIVLWGTHLGGHNGGRCRHAAVAAADGSYHLQHLAWPRHSQRRLYLPVTGCWTPWPERHGIHDVTADDDIITSTSRAG